MHGRILIGVALAGLSGALLLFASSGESCLPPRMAAWLEQAGPTRPSRARLSGFPHAPWENPRSPGSFATPLRRELLELEIEIEAAAESHPSPENLRALGVLELLRGQIDDSASTLRAAVSQASARAPLWNDLSVALFEKARHSDRAHLYIGSLQAALKAHQLDPDLSEASYNLALGLDALFLREAARRFCPVEDSDPEFQEEARELARRQSTPVISEVWARRSEMLFSGLEEAPPGVEFAQLVREWAMEQGLARWAELIQRGEPREAESVLKRIRSAGDWLRRISGDSTVAAAVALADRYEASPSRLAQAWSAYADGQKLFRAGSLEESRSRLEAAREFFGEVQSAWTGWCDASLAAIEIQQGQHSKAKSRARGALARIDARPFPALSGRLEWAVGLVELRAGRLLESLSRFQTAARRFDAAQQWLYRGAVDALIAENLNWLGRGSEAWGFRREALRRLSQFPDAYYLHNALGDSAHALAEEGQLELALQFRDEGVAVARRTGEPETLAEALQWRGETLSQLGKRTAAVRDLNAARQLSERILDRAFRRQVALDIRVALAETLRHSNPRAALEHWSGADAEYREKNLDLERVDAALTGYRILRALGRSEKARVVLEGAVEQLEKQNEMILRSFGRRAHFRRVGALFQEVVGFEWSRGRARSALRYADRKQQALFGSRPRDESLDHWRRQIPEDTAIIEYAVIEDRLLIWVLTREELHHDQRMISAQLLSDRIDESFRALSVGEESRTGLTQLYEDLIAPVEEQLMDKRRLLVVADQGLRLVPFGALRKTARDSPLIRRWAVAKIPSAAALASRPARPGDPSDLLPALLVGDPAFDFRRLDWLSRLPGAAAEARELAALHGAESRLLVGAEATPEAILSGLPRTRIFHFAGHALQAQTPQLLAAGKDGSGAVSLADLERLKFPYLEVAALSACAAADDRRLDAEGAYGLAYPFLRGGAGAVVAALWRIPDQPTRELMLNFHRELRSGASPLSALRSAQLRFLDQEERRPGLDHLWAAFDLVATDWKAVR